MEPTDSAMPRAVALGVPYGIASPEPKMMIMIAKTNDTRGLTCVSRNVNISVGRGLQPLISWLIDRLVYA